MKADLTDRYHAALNAVEKASKAAWKHYVAGVTYETKSDATPVTIADREAESILREELGGTFPNDGFLGEEYGDRPGSSGFKWIADPIDGTRNFIRGVPLWGTLLGLEYRGDLVAGVCSCPGTGQTWHAMRGHGAWLGNTKINVSSINTLKQSHIYYSSISYFDKHGKASAFLDLVRDTERQRGFGDYFGFMLVAQGAGEVMIDHGVHAWDVAACKPIIEEAGGKMTNWDGGWDVFKPDVIASNGKLHDFVVKSLG